MKKTDDAVSPVVATILLVAIAVGLAAIIAAAAFGMVGNLEGGKMVSLTVDTQASSSGNIIVTYTGGNDLAALSGLRVTSDGETISAASSYSFPPSVGTIQQYTAPKGKHRIIVVGIFDDYEQILYDQDMIIR
ncbi:MAG TPA: type IV pilin [Methanocorpusculum sp.]|nr:type IV pilin [Methanocorpusculum sp.]